jgi:ribose 5-phosphate isomerase B
MRICAASDHAGIEMRKAMVEVARRLGHEVVDFGPETAESTDYPVWGAKVGKAVASGEFDRGLLVCGTGLGISLAANKIHGIRAALCSETYTARLSREHNNANVLAVGARVIGVGTAEMVTETWLTSEFEGDRHGRRVGLLDALDRGEDIC